MTTLNDWLSRARREGYAIGHFNVSNLEGMRAVVRAAVRLRAPVIVGLSEGEREFFGVRQAAAAVRVWREETGLPIFLNADHTKTLEKIKEAVEAGFDSVHFDGSRLDYDTNVRETKRAVEYAKSKNPNISVEGELGYLRGSSNVQETVELKPEDMTDPDRAAEFVKLTGVDRLAPVFGNIHGIVTKQKETLDLERLAAIRAKTDAFLVVHGGSGLSDDDIRGAIRAGIVKVHINTELRVAYRHALDETLRQMPAETRPYRYLAPAGEAMQRVVEAKIELFGSAGKVA
jgi:fructose-bisphosphate aldolase class II